MNSLIGPKMGGAQRLLVRFWIETNQRSALPIFRPINNAHTRWLVVIGQTYNRPIRACHAHTRWLVQIFRFRFAQWGGAEFTRYLMSSRVTDVLDFQLINIDTRNYYMFLGSEVVDDFSKWAPTYWALSMYINSTCLGSSRDIADHFIDTIWYWKGSTNLWVYSLLHRFRWLRCEFSKNFIWIWRNFTVSSRFPASYPTSTV